MYIFKIIYFFFLSFLSGRCMGGNHTSHPSLMVRMVELMAVLASVHTSSPVMASVNPGTTEPREIFGSTYAIHDMNPYGPSTTVAALVVGPYWLVKNAQAKTLPLK